MGDPGLRKAVITGGTGLVGRRLAEVLLRQGAQVAVVSRTPGRARLPEGARAISWEELPDQMDGADAVFNLAGESLADGRWSPRRKAAIRDSRLEATRLVVDAMRRTARRPAVLVNASATGFYGPRGEDLIDETAPAGQGFLADVCRAWEGEAEAVRGLGVRLVKLRLGIVLARTGGALPEMARPVRLGLGCPLGSGRQGISWIHLEDLVRLLLEAAADPAWEGSINATAPEPLSQEAFTRTLARELHRPVWPVPAFLTRLGTRLLLGEMAEALLLRGAYVLPRKALALGFAFRFGTLREALADLLGRG
ncbi:MAG TPA: TIGR01777 family oxidoreductase [Holophaga sp.]|nr:TIGR01777 family oxidoreductase [Holophaga sp.]